MKKVTVVGAGNVGSQAAFVIGLKNLADVVLIDVVEGIPQGKALDMQQAMPCFGSDAKIIGTNSYEDTKDSDIVVITAGVARKPGMTREDLLNTNAKIVKEVTDNIMKFSKSPILIVVTNPLDAMVYHVYKISKLPKEKVMGMAGVLDSARFTSFVANELNVSVNDIEAMVLGSHGVGMTVVTESSKVSGIPLPKKLGNEKTNALIDRVRNAGIEIVNYLKTGSAFFAPGTSVAIMVESIIKEDGKILPASAYVEGEYGVSGVFLGVPVKLGKNGVKEIIEIPLSDKEKEEFLTNAKNVKEQVSQLIF